MIKVEVNPGACGLLSVIEALSRDNLTSDIKITSQCPDIIKIGEKLGSIDVMKEIFTRFGDSSIFTLSREHCSHATCPVPTAILKAAEASCNLALPKDISMKITKK